MRVRRHKNIVSLWIKSTGTAIAKIKSKNEGLDFATIFAYSLTEWQLNCSNLQMKIISSIDYDFNSSVISSSNQASDWNDIVPESMMEIVANKVCK